MTGSPTGAFRGGGTVEVSVSESARLGKATKELLESRGDRVIGADIHDAEVVADLSTEHGRAELVAQVRRLSGGRVDAVYAVAGLALPVPATVGVNYFGMIATLEGLRPLLASSPAPRAVGVTSMASLLPVDDELVELLTAGNEPEALARQPCWPGSRRPPAR